MDTPLQIGLRSARALALPAVVLLSAGTGLVVAYYEIPAVTGALSHVADLKARFGYGFSFTLNFVLVGMVPWGFRMLSKSLRPERPLADLLFGSLWWAFVGVVVDVLYRNLGYAFDATGWSAPVIVAVKTFLDMLFFTTLLAAPGNALAHLWKDMDYDFKKLRANMGPGWYRRLVLPNLIPNYMLWVPGVALVFSMPDHLQLALSSIIGCFWALMCLQIAERSRGRIVVEPGEA